MNFNIITPGIKTVGQALVKKLGPNFTKVSGTVGKADLNGLKFADLAKSIEGIEGTVVKELPNGHKVVKLKNCCYLNSLNIPKNVVVTFNKEGDCLMLSGAGKSGNVTKGFSLRTDKGIDAMLEAGVKQPGQRVVTTIIPKGRWIAENSGTPAQDIICQAYEYPHLGKALQFIPNK